MACAVGSAAARLILCACLLMAVTSAVAQWNDEEAQKDCVNKNECTASFPVIPACKCSDIAPVFYAGGPVNATCLTVLQQNNCGQPWINNVSVSEISEGYCQISCNRCNCCKTFADALTANSYSTFLQAANAAGLRANLTSPAYSFTLLAPSDAAFTAFLRRNRMTLAMLLADILTLRRVITYHLLPNVPVLDAYWTTPFLLPGTILSTLLGPTATITVGPGPTFNNAARAATPDIPVCKGNIIGIDAVLTPPANAAARTPPLLDPSFAATNAAKITGLTTPPDVLARVAAAPQQVMLPRRGTPAHTAPLPQTIPPSTQAAAARASAAITPQLQNSAATGP